MILKGKAHVYGDDVDTDAIIPAYCLAMDSPEEIAVHAMEYIDHDFVKRVEEGDIIIGGINFGSGSSREQAPRVLLDNGITVVIAKSFPPIFRKNSISIGLYPIICEEDISVDNGDSLEIDLEEYTLTNHTTGEKYPVLPLKPREKILAEHKGMINYTKAMMDADN